MSGRPPSLARTAGRSLPILTLLGLIAAAPAASAATYYVSPTGSDAAACSATAPCRQIRRALLLVAPGDTVLVADGDYLGFDVRDLDGTARRPHHDQGPGRGSPRPQDDRPHRQPRHDLRHLLVVHRPRRPALVLREPRGRPRRREPARDDPQRCLRQQLEVGHLHRLLGRPPDREQRVLRQRHPARHLRLQQRRPAGGAGQPRPRQPRLGHPVERRRQHGRRRPHHRGAHREQRHLQQRRGRRRGDQPRRRAGLDRAQQPPLQQPRLRASSTTRATAPRVRRGWRSSTTRSCRRRRDATR